MERGPRRDRIEGRLTAALVDQPRAEGEALLALAPPGPEPGVPLHRLDVPMAELDRLLHLVERHVLAPAEHHLVHQTPSSVAIAFAAARPCVIAAPTSRTPVH